MNLIFHLKLVSKRFRYFGLTRCPVCRSRVRMMSSGSGHLRMVELGVPTVKKRQAVQCPICYTKERQRALVAFLTEEVGLFSRRNLDVLHFAPEYWLGRTLPFSLTGLYVPGDLNPGAYRHVHGIRRVDITAMDSQMPLSTW
jgi:hypothetical protein